ncbi:MAG: signal recognition particle-docking protein FtsY [Clostridia bacterium]|nr:signal recognition particle-docking protein FtsY [Clostridia bacterium]
MGLFSKLKDSLNKTKEAISERIEDALSMFKSIDDDLFEELEEILIMADIGVETSVEIIERLKKAAKEKHITDGGVLKEELRCILETILSEGENSLVLKGKPAVIMVIGVNGVGKTTSIGKMAHMYKEMGKKVIIAAADTFRAAAIEQLEVWADRADAEIIKQHEGSDPAAVIYDAIGAAKNRGADILLCDTAGRLHNKKNLMEELKKIYRILDKELPDSSKEVLLVLDATTGQNAVSQAKQFKEAADITGIVLTKLDGTAKGGIVFAIKNEYDIPVKFVGLGEGIDDMEEFNPVEFVNAIIEPEGEKTND